MFDKILKFDLLLSLESPFLALSSCLLCSCSAFLLSLRSSSSCLLSLSSSFRAFSFFFFSNSARLQKGKTSQASFYNHSRYYLTVFFASTLQWSGVLLLLLLPLLLLLLLLSLRNIMVPRPRTFLPPSRLSPDL